MAYVHRHQAPSMSGQRYHLHHRHRYHTHSRRPPVIVSSVNDNDAHSGWVENEGDYQNMKRQRQVTTTAWRFKLHQQTMIETQAQTQQQQSHQQHSRGHSVHANNVNPNRTLSNEHDGHEKEWGTPIATAQTLLKHFTSLHPHIHTNRGKSTSATTHIITSGTTSAEELEKSLEMSLGACEDNDPAKWTIQTLFEIGTCCGAEQTEQIMKVVRYHVDVEKRVSQFVMDAFHSYMNRWTWEDCCTSDENENVNGVTAHNKNIERGNSLERAYSIERTRDDMGMKKKNNGDDLISWDSDEERGGGPQIDYKAATDKNELDQTSANKRRPRPVTHTHRQILLDAILEGRSALQVFLAIDTFALGDSLSLLIPKKDVKSNNMCSVDREHDTNASDDQNTQRMENEQQSYSPDYGSLLTMHLIQRRYLHAAIQLNSRMRHAKLYNHHHDQRQEVKEQGGKSMASMNLAERLLVNHLLDKVYLDLIHLFVNMDRDLCRTVLQMIDCRFAGQIWAWVEGGVVDSSQLDPFLVVQCRSQVSSTSSTAFAATLSEKDSLPMLFGMLEIANSLGMSFGLENTMRSFRSIQFIQEYCTVISLLTNHNNHNLTTHRGHQKYKHNNNATPTPTTAQQSIPNLNPWMFIPSVLPILKQTPALQRLVVWIFVMHEDGVATAELLASALGLCAFFAQCVRHQNDDEEEDNGGERERNEEKSDQMRRCGSDYAAKATRFLEHSLVQVQGQSIEMNTSLQKGSSKGNERYMRNKYNKDAAVTEEYSNIDHEEPSPADYHKTTGPLLVAPFTQAFLLDVNNSINNNNNYHAMKHNTNTLLQPAMHFQNTFTRPTLMPLQTYPPSVPSSASTLLSRAPNTMTFFSTSPTSSSSSSSDIRQNKPLLIRRSHTTASSTTKKQDLFHSNIFKYRHSSETSIILVNQMSQLKQLYGSLFHSDIVGMSLIRPLAKPWARSKHLPPDQLQQKMLLLLQQQQEGTMRTKKLGEGGEGGGSGGQCAYLQLASGSDKHVYVVDLEVFLDEEVDPSHKFPRLIGEIFFNPSICKLAYNWFEEATFLKTLFPALGESQYRMDNFIDLFYIWIAPNPNFNPNRQPSSSSSSSSSSSHNPPATITTNKKINAWYCGSGRGKNPYFPTVMSQPRYGNVSGLLMRVMGQFLRRTSKLGWDAWTVRPLPVCLQTDLAMSAQCLVDLFAVLDKDGQRKEREETVEFMVQAVAK